jgi:hypothetical protein
VAPSPGEEEGSTPTPPSGVEDWIVTQVRPDVAAVPVEETTAVPDFTIEPENQTEWEPAYTSPLPGGYGGTLVTSWSLTPTCFGWGLSLGPVSVSPALTLAGCLLASTTYPRVTQKTCS